MLLDIYTGEIERFGLPQSIEFISTSEEHAGLERFLEHNGYERLDNTPLMVRAGLQDIHVTEDDIPVPDDPGQYAVFAELPDEILLQGNDLADAENRPLPEGGFRRHVPRDGRQSRLRRPDPARRVPRVPD